MNKDQEIRIGHPANDAMEIAQAFAQQLETPDLAGPLERFLVNAGEIDGLDGVALFVRRDKYCPKGLSFTSFLDLQTTRENGPEGIMHRAEDAFVRELRDREIGLVYDSGICNTSGIALADLLPRLRREFLNIDESSSADYLTFVTSREFV